MRRLTFPVPTGILVLLVAGVAGSALLHTAGYWNWPYGDWVAASAETRQALTLAGPWLAGCCAWTAARFTTSRGILCPGSAPRSGFPLVKAQLRVLVGWAVVGYLAGLAPVMISTVLKAEVGSLNWLVLAGSLAALSAFACLGYLLGCILQLSLAAFLAVIVSFAVMLWPEPLGPVAPIWEFGVVAGLEENPGVAVFRLLFFLVVSACCIAASTWWLRERTSPMTLVPLSGVLLLGVPLILGAVAADRSPDVVRHEVDPASRCQLADGVEVSVHAAKSVLLADLVDSVEAIRSAWGPEGFPTARVLDSVLWIAPSPPGVVVLDLQTQDPGGWRDAAVQDLAWELSGAGACAVNYESITDPEQLDASAMSGAVGMWLATQAGALGPGLSGDPEVLAIAQRLEQLPPVEVQGLLARLQPELARCTARSTELP